MDENYPFLYELSMGYTLVTSIPFKKVLCQYLGKNPQICFKKIKIMSYNFIWGNWKALSKVNKLLLYKHKNEKSKS